MCEEFDCLPSQARKELRLCPELVADVMQMRAYASTRQALLDARDEKDVPKGPLADLVIDTELEIMRDRQRRDENDDADE